MIFKVGWGKSGMRKGAFLLGLFLLGLNLYGLTVSLRNPDIYELRDGQFGIELTEEEFYDEIERLKGESDEEYAVRMTDVVNRGMVHYWEDDGMDEYNIQLGWEENYLIRGLGYVYPAKFEKYEFYDMEKAVERGVGLCSQHAIVLEQVLEDEEIDAELIWLEEHVVVEVDVGEGMVLDPDYGVVLEMGLENVLGNEGVVVEAYGEGMEDVYQEKKLMVGWWRKTFGARNFAIENGLYGIKWGLPLFLVWFGLRKKRFEERNLVFD